MKDLYQLSAVFIDPNRGEGTLERRSSEVYRSRSDAMRHAEPFRAQTRRLYRTDASYRIYVTARRLIVAN